MPFLNPFLPYNKHHEDLKYRIRKALRYPERHQKTRTREMAAAIEEVNYDNYSDKELSALKDEINQKISFILQENKLLESYLLRVNPNALKTLHTDFAGDSSNQGATTQAVVTRKKKELKREDASKPILLTAEQKCEIATRELEELRDEIEKQKDEWGKVLDNLKAEMEEVDIRVAEVKKAMFEFKRDIVGQAVNSRTGKVIAERILRYYEDKIRAKVIRI